MRPIAIRLEHMSEKKKPTGANQRAEARNRLQHIEGREYDNK